MARSRRSLAGSGKRGADRSRPRSGNRLNVSACKASPPQVSRSDEAHEEKCIRQNTVVGSGRVTSHTGSVWQLQKCKAAIPICPATYVWFHHCRQCGLLRSKICRCGNAPSAARISLQPNGLSTSTATALGTLACGYQFEDVAYFPAHALTGSD